MNTSDTINEIAKALASAQAEMPAAQMNAKNPFLKSKYADLTSVTEAVRGVLGKHGLCYVQMPSIPPGEAAGIALTTRLMHLSGEWIEDTFVMPMPEEERGKSAMQIAGSAISYARRYALSAMLGVVTDEDADGSASRQPAGDIDMLRNKPPKAKANGSGSGTWSPDFLAHVLKEIPYYSHERHVLNAAAKLSLDPPANKAQAKELFAIFASYADQRQAEKDNGQAAEVVEADGG